METAFQDHDRTERRAQELQTPGAIMAADRAEKAEHKRAKKARARARQAERDERNMRSRRDEMAMDIQVNMEIDLAMGANQAHMKESPALCLLLGTHFKQYSAEQLFDRLVEVLEHNVTQGSGTIYKGRTIDLFRINYHPRNNKVFSIKSRVMALLSPSINYEELDALLAPLLVSNPHIFGVNQDKQLKNLLRASGAHKLDAKSFRSHWSFFTKLLSSVRPVTWERRDSVVATILNTVRQHCNQRSPDSSLLLDPGACGEVYMENEAEFRRIYAWSLYGNNMGLAMKLEACFQDAYRTSVEYEDLLEQVLYCFKKANRVEIYGGKGYPQAPTYDDAGESKHDVKLEYGIGEVGDQEDGGIKIEEGAEGAEYGDDGVKIKVEEDEKHDGEDRCLIM